MPEPPRQEDIDELMKVLGANPLKAAPPPPAPPADSEPRKEASPGRGELEPLGAAAAVRQEAGLDLLSDVDVQVRIELGNARMLVQDVLKLGPGSLVGLESLVADPVNVFVNDRLVARGEVLVVNDNFAVRIIEVLPQPKAEGM